jgi:hypothetical protein
MYVRGGMSGHPVGGCSKHVHSPRSRHINASPYKSAAGLGVWESAGRAGSSSRTMTVSLNDGRPCNPLRQPGDRITDELRVVKQGGRKCAGHPDIRTTLLAASRFPPLHDLPRQYRHQEDKV